jgi:hypothetical protein
MLGSQKKSFGMKQDNTKLPGLKDIIDVIISENLFSMRTSGIEYSNTW